MNARHDVAVIGAGVFGAWTAWHLQQAGMKVLLVDQYGPASTRASSGGQTRVIRMAYGPDDIYTRLSVHALVQWKTFFARIRRPDLFRETGVLWLAPADSVVARQSLATLARFEVPHEVLDPEALALRFPQIAIPEGGWGLFEPRSGALLARDAVQAVVEDALHAGVAWQTAKVVTPGPDAHLSAITTIDGKKFHADRFVFACGPWLHHLLPDALAGRLFPTRQEVFYFGVPAGDQRFATPEFPIWLDFDRDWYGFPDLQGRGFKIAHDSHGAPIDPDSAERVPDAQRLERAREFVAKRFPGLSGAPLVGSEVCQYENTSNGDFLIDRHPAFDNVWMAGGGSGHGFKHGPAIGEHVAALVRGAVPAEPRFSLATKRTVQHREIH